MDTKNCKGHEGQQSFVFLRALRGSSLLVCLVGGFALSIAACGGPQIGAPTAIPADITVPDQPAPVYAEDATLFTLATPAPPVFANASVGSSSVGAAGAMERTVNVLPYRQTPSALGIVRGGAVMRSVPGGTQIGSLPAGATVTITGKSADGSAYAVFGQDAVTGWLAANAVAVYGGDDLLVVDFSLGPGPIATLMAEAMIPVGPSVLEGVGRE